MKECSTIKNSQKLATLAVMAFLLFISTPIAPDAPDETEVSLNSAIKVTPEKLDYDNMLAWVPKSTTLTITNISGNDIRITPSMDFGAADKAFLESKLEICDSEPCTPVTQFTKIDIPKGGHQDIVVTITLTDNSKEARSISIAGDLQVTGEVLNE